jgi:DNA polymerase III epsilon subunit family exonuclease
VSDRPLKKLLGAKTFCVFDLETTGFEPESGAEPIEIGAVRIVNGTTRETFQTFVSPDGEIPSKIQSLTGITPDDVEGAPTVDKALRDFHEFAGDAVLVAHNVDFDRSFLDAYAPNPFNNDEIDTLRMSRKLLGSTKNSLDHLVQTYGLERSDSHRALSDAEATAQLFLKLVDRISTYDDYRRCGIPTSVMKEDLELILRVTGFTTREKKALNDSFKTVSEVMDASTSRIGELCDVSPGRAGEIVQFLEQIRSDPSVDLEPAPSLTNCFRVRYWNWTNRIVNLIGGLCLVGGFFTVNRNLALTLFLTSVPFFLVSPALTYFRDSNGSLIKQLLSVLIILAGWTGVLWYFGLDAGIRTILAELLRSQVLR